MRKILAVLLAAALLVGCTPTTGAEVQKEKKAEKEFRGVWVSTVLNLDYPSGRNLTESALKAEADKILDDAERMGFNAVIFQVRPAGDALYKSDLFPWSKYLTGTQGKAPENGFDPLQYYIDGAHARGMELHAWINPYRVTKKESGEAKHDFASLADTNPAKLHRSWVVEHTDGNLYYNPGIPEVRELLIDGVLEIVRKYDVDGIHFDDYFYPSAEFDDAATYQQYKGSFTNIKDWRRNNVDVLIRDLGAAIREADPDCAFGISPFGIWANKKSNPLGSDTSGGQSYYDHYADTRKWVKNGWLTYIAPQLYWNIGNTAADYEKLVAWWSDTVKGTDVKLYIGHGAYRAGNSDPSSPWYGVEEIRRQVEMNRSYPEVAGSIFFRIKTITAYPALVSVFQAMYGAQEQDGADTAEAKYPLVVARPLSNISTAYENFYICGTSDAGQALCLNGKPVENRSSDGFFGAFVALEKGANTFTFTQGGQSVTRSIYRGTPPSASKPEPMSAAEIPASSVFPQKPEYRRPGETVTLRCTAPIGAKVTAKFMGNTYTLYAASSVKPSPSGAYPTTYSRKVTLPAASSSGRLITFKAPVYTMTYAGKSKARTAPNPVVVVQEGAPFYAEVITDGLDTHSDASASSSNYELCRGMRDYVTGMTGDYVRLSMGQWVKKSGVKTYATQLPYRPKVTAVSYAVGEKWDTVAFTLNAPVAATASFDGEKLTLSMPTSSGGAQLGALPDGALVSGAQALLSQNRLTYTLPLREGKHIEGYYIEMTDTGMNLKLKRPAKAAPGERPLAGIRIVVDPGHGGDAPGAVGPLGAQYPEKAVNLQNALKLEAHLKALGAEVIMTRTDDTDVSLARRLDISRQARPDMFISVHANSMNDNVDIGKIAGGSVFYKDAVARGLAKTVHDNTLAELGRASKGLRVVNHYVSRGTWTPSFIYEVGFMPNPWDFQWMITGARQEEWAASTANAIVSYFKSDR